MVRMRSPVRIWPAAPRRSKVRFAPAFSISRGIENTIRSAPLLLLSNPNPLRWASGLFFGKTKGEPDAFSVCRGKIRAGDLTGKACFNKNRRPPQAVTASSNLASSSTSEQSPLCSGVFYFTGNRKHHPLRSLAPPFKPEPALLGFGFVFWRNERGAGRFFKLQDSIPNWRPPSPRGTWPRPEEN